MTRSPAKQAARLCTDLARIDTAERGLITELEQPAAPAVQVYRPGSANGSPSSPP